MLDENFFKEEYTYNEFCALSQEQKDLLVKELVDVISENKITSIFNLRLFIRENMDLKYLYLLRGKNCSFFYYLCSGVGQQEKGKFKGRYSKSIIQYALEDNK